ncbi:hypothetical protein SAMN05660875_105234 [Stutzerimonas balearica DSM 6083]|uniref:Uncharacterized protein n=1 Tax=Stutzerimonas balearica DSM 6083 TaxID=1123016 RepID=A0ABY0R4Z9_9GAMM|nr:hypothetical protein SAMN05660875_105234 [Stutzerimonas balearica DSM 6083]
MRQARQFTVKSALRAQPGEPAVIGGLAVVLQREAVAELALAVIAAQLVGIVACGLSIPDQRDALLLDSLVGIVLQALRPCLGTVRPDLIQRQATGIFGAVVDCMEGEPERAALPLPAQLASEVVGFGGAVRAVAVELCGVDGEQGTQRAGTATGFRTHAAIAQFAAGHLDLRERRVARFSRLDRQDATGGIAVDGGRRTANHLDALDQRGIQPIHLGLPVRHGQRHPVDQHPHAANAKTGARPEAANGQAHALRQVVAALRKRARHRPEQAVEGEQLLAGLVLRRHGGHRHRQGKPVGFRPG